MSAIISPYWLHQSKQKRITTKYVVFGGGKIDGMFGEPYEVADLWCKDLVIAVWKIKKIKGAAVETAAR